MYRAIVMCEYIQMLENWSTVLPRLAYLNSYSHAESMFTGGGVGTPLLFAQRGGIRIPAMIEGSARRALAHC